MIARSDRDGALRREDARRTALALLMQSSAALIMALLITAMIFDVWSASPLGFVPFIAVLLVFFVSSALLMGAVTTLPLVDRPHAGAPGAGLCWFVVAPWSLQLGRAGREVFSCAGLPRVAFWAQRASICIFLLAIVTAIIGLFAFGRI